MPGIASHKLFDKRKRRYPYTEADSVLGIGQWMTLVNSVTYAARHSSMYSLCAKIVDMLCALIVMEFKQAHAPDLIPRQAVVMCLSGPSVVPLASHTTLKNDVG
jgi:hypothetical protein